MMDNTKAWEAFFCTGRVCDYLQYAAESRQMEMLGGTVQNVNEGETKTPCSVSRTE